MAESFARIFYRNAFTIGLPALEKPEIEGKIDQKDELKVVMTNYTVENIRTKETLHARKVLEFKQQMLWKGDWLNITKNINNFHGFKDRT